MKCPFCDFIDTQVKDSRPSEDGEIIKRRRSCHSCGGRFITLERREIPEIKIVKRSGVKRPFDSQKLLKSIMIPMRKRPVNTDVIEQIISNILKKIEKFGEGEISSTVIGQLVMNELADVDQVAYVRYASVYKEFKSVDDFGEFIKTMAKKNVDTK
jgi:transcriptional repressor NrdR